MNDERMEPMLRAWLRQRDVPPADPTRTAACVGARLPRVRQRRRRSVLRTLGRGRASATPDQPLQHRSDTAATDLSPTITGRTQTVFSPVKAIAAGALVLAASAAFFVAQPFGRPGDAAPGAADDAEPVLPVEVTGTFQGLSCENGGGSELVGPVRTSARICTVRNEWSDPRLQGTETYRDIGAKYIDDSFLYVGHYVHDIETDEGAWRMRPQFRFETAGIDGPESFSGTWILDGEGAYEGLSAILHKSVSDTGPLRGFIVSTELLPQAPEAASTE